MYLIIAILIICAAHFIRILRWEQLIATYEKPDGVRLTESLSLGYFLNWFLPFKLGDFARALYAGRRMRNGRGFALATVIVERCLDILTVGAIFIAGKIIRKDLWGDTALYYIFLAGIVAAALLLILILKKYIKRLICAVGGLLSEKYEEKVLRFFWALIWGFKDVVYSLAKVKLIAYTVIMWVLYLCSYAAFAAFLAGAGISRGFIDVFMSLFDRESLLSSGLSTGAWLDAETMWYAVYMIGALVVLTAGAEIYARLGYLVNIKHKSGPRGGFLFLGIGDRPLYQKTGKGDRPLYQSGESLEKTRDFEDEKLGYRGQTPIPKNGERGQTPIPENGEVDIKSERLNLLPQANVDERRAFLKMYFAGQKREYIENYLKINRNILVLRDYSAGSNATTILCTDGSMSFYRKYAFAEAAGKLSEQIEWMRAHEDTLPLAKVLRADTNEVACYYDMPYSSDAMTMFEYAESGEKEKAFEILKNVLAILEEKLYNVEDTGDSGDNAQGIGDNIVLTEVVNTAGDDKGSISSNNIGTSYDMDTLHRYIRDKIVKNLNTILSSRELKELTKYKTVFINGKEYKNLPEYVDLFTEEKLAKIFANDPVSDIHGDLTIENIVCIKRSTADIDGSLITKSCDSVKTGTKRSDFYLIDPNTGNIFNSKYIDYAKILQSLHGNYELIMAVNDVSVDGNHIDYKFVESDAYAYMYREYMKYLEANFSEVAIKSIRYHEIVNWLRLMPYKISKGRGELFYAGLIKILDEVM